jgi:hypothetical protein
MSDNFIVGHLTKHSLEVEGRKSDEGIVGCWVMVQARFMRLNVAHGPGPAKNQCSSATAYTNTSHALSDLFPTVYICLGRRYKKM